MTHAHSGYGRWLWQQVQYGQRVVAALNLDILNIWALFTRLENNHTYNGIGKGKVL